MIYIYIFSRNSAGVSEICPEGGELNKYIYISSLGIVMEYMRYVLKVGNYIYDIYIFSRNSDI